MKIDYKWYSFIKVPFITIKQYFSNYENIYFLALSLLQLSTLWITPSEWSPTGPYGTSIPLLLVILLEVLLSIVSWFKTYILILKDNHIIVKCLNDYNNSANIIIIDEELINVKDDDLNQSLKINNINFNNKSLSLKYKKDLNENDTILLRKNEIIPKCSTIIRSSEEYSRIDLSLVNGESAIQFVNDSRILPIGAIIKSNFVELLIKLDNNEIISDVKKSNNSLDNYVSNFMLCFSIPSLIAIIIFSSIYRMYIDNKIDLSYFIQTLILFNGLIPFSVKIFLLISRKLMSLRSNILINNNNTIDDFEKIKMIVSDKTGTITQNKLEFIECLSIDNDYSFLQFSIHQNIDDFDTQEDKVIAEACKHLKIPLNIKNEEIFRYPFNSESKMSGSIINCTNSKFSDSQKRFYVKGSIDSIKNRLNLNQKKLVDKLYKRLTLSYPNARILAFGYKIMDKNDSDKNILTSELEFCGLVAMRDCLQNDVKNTIKYLDTQYGVRVSICTGDRKYVCLNIANEIGILKNVVNFKNIDKVDSLENSTLMICPDDIKYIHKQLLSKVNNFIAYDMKPNDKALLTSMCDNVMSIGDGFNDIGMFENSDESVSIKGYEFVENKSKYCISEFSELVKLFDFSNECRKRNKNLINFTFYRCSVVVSVLFSYYFKNNYISPFDGFVLTSFNNLWTFSTLYYIITNNLNHYNGIHYWNIKGILLGIFLTELFTGNLLTLISIVAINFKWIEWNNKSSIILACVGPFLYSLIYPIRLEYNHLIHLICFTTLFL